MAATDHLRPEQLKMFMTAHEITQQYQGLDGDRVYRMNKGLEDDSAMLTRKYQETVVTQPNTASSIREHGVERPIDLTHEVGSLGKPMIGDGHHRLSVEAFENRQRLIPVQHHRSFFDLAWDRAHNIV